MAGIIFTNGKFQGIGNDGKVVPYGKLYFTRCCDGVAVATYRDSQLTSTNTHPVNLSASGKADVFLVAGTYDVALTDKSGVTIWTINNFEPTGGTSGGGEGVVVKKWRENFTAVSGQTIFNATRAIDDVNVYINGVLLTPLVDYTIASIVLTLLKTSEEGDEISIIGGEPATGEIQLPDVVGRVLTISDMVNNVDKSIYSCVIVQEDGVGGTFNYISSLSAINDGGTIFNGWVREFSDAVLPEWFGAGDNIESAVIFNSILANFTNIRLSPNTTYLINQSIVYPSNTKIVGDVTSVLKATADAVYMLTTGRLGATVENVHLEGFTVDGSGGVTGAEIKRAWGIYGSAIKDVTVKDVTVKNMGTINPASITTDLNYGGYGIFFEARFGAIDNILIDNCTVKNIAGGGMSAGDGIVINGYSNSDIVEPVNAVVQNCHASTVGRHCYTIAGESPESIPSNIVLSKCYGEKSALDGIDMENGQYVTVDKCTFSACGNDQTYLDPVAEYGATYRLLAAIALGNDTEHIKINKCNFLDGNYYGISTAGKYINISSCDFPVGGTLNGDMIRGLAGSIQESSILDNDMSNVTDSFPTSFQMKNSSVRGNNIVMATGHKLRLKDTDNVNVDKNRISGAISIGDENTNPRVINNLITGLAGYVAGIIGEAVASSASTDVLISGNIIEGDSVCDGIYTNRDQFVNVSILDNSIKSVVNGVNFANVDDGVIDSISRNTIRDFTASGVLIGGATHAQGCKISDNTIEASILTGTIGISRPNVYIDSNDDIITGNLILNCGDGIKVVESAALYDNAIISLNNTRNCTVGVTVPANSNIVLNNK